MATDAFPKSFPCRIDLNARAVHCDSCEMVPGLLAKIDKLNKALDTFFEFNVDASSMYENTLRYQLNQTTMKIREIMAGG